MKSKLTVPNVVKGFFKAESGLNLDKLIR